MRRPSCATPSWSPVVRPCSRTARARCGSKTGGWVGSARPSLSPSLRCGHAEALAHSGTFRAWQSMKDWMVPPQGGAVTSWTPVRSQYSSDAPVRRFPIWGFIPSIRDREILGRRSRENCPGRRLVAPHDAVGPDSEPAAIGRRENRRLWRGRARHRGVSASGTPRHSPKTPRNGGKFAAGSRSGHGFSGAAD